MRSKARSNPDQHDAVHRCACCAGGVPWFAGKITQELLANVGIFLLLALGLNIVVGLAGLLDLGYVAFFAVGAYTHRRAHLARLSRLVTPELPGSGGALPS